MADRIVRDENDAGVLRRDVDMGDGTWAERSVTVTPDGTPEFFNGREFRCVFEFSTQNGNPITTGQRILIRAVLSVNTILTLAAAAIESGFVRIRSFAGGTPTGSFTTLPILRANAMTTVPVYTPTMVFSATAPGLPAAVDITGGVLSDTVRAKTASQSVATATVTAAAGTERGLPPGTVYILIESLGPDPAEGIIRFRWTELP